METIIQGDSIIEMNKMAPESVDLIFADPPYWMRTEGELNRTEGTIYNGCDDTWDQFESPESYETFTNEWLAACHRILKPNGSIWVIGGMQCIYTVGATMQKLGFWFINDVIWYKKNPTPNFRGTRLNNSHETLIWATKSKKSRYTFNYKTAKELNTDTVDEKERLKGIRKQMGSVWRFPICSGNERLKNNKGEKLHSTQKPLAMLERILAISTHENDIVLDPFGGTMTTAAAAKIMGRQYIMIEREASYCKAGKLRLSQIAFEPSSISKAEFDIKPIKATLTDMINAGFLLEGEDLFLSKGDQPATLQSDGKVNYCGLRLDIHTCAAKAVGGKSNRLNGFDYWYVKRQGSLISIKKIREDYRKHLLKKQQ